jgi:hypothetical protein
LIVYGDTQRPLISLFCLTLKEDVTRSRVAPTQDKSRYHQCCAQYNRQMYDDSAIRFQPNP